MKTAMEHAQELASFAFNTAMRDLKPKDALEDLPGWLDRLTDESATQIAAAQADARREALEQTHAVAIEHGAVAVASAISDIIEGRALLDAKPGAWMCPSCGPVGEATDHDGKCDDCGAFCEFDKTVTVRALLDAKPRADMRCAACDKPFTSPDHDPRCSSCVEAGIDVEETT